MSKLGAQHWGAHNFYKSTRTSSNAFHSAQTDQKLTSYFAIIPIFYLYSENLICFWNVVLFSKIGYIRQYQTSQTLFGIDSASADMFAQMSRTIQTAWLNERFPPENHGLHIFMSFESCFSLLFYVENVLQKTSGLVKRATMRMRKMWMMIVLKNEICLSAHMYFHAGDEECEGIF